jgi:hypothetical protein
MEKFHPYLLNFADVLHRVGFAVWQLQALEQVAACHLVLVHKVTVSTAREEVHRIFQKSEKNTLGQLFGQIRDLSNGTASFLPRFEALVQERNWLVHHSRNENRSDLFDDNARQKVIDRIETMANEAYQLALALKATTEDHMVSQGITKEEIDRRASQIFREWTDQT